MGSGLGCKVWQWRGSLTDTWCFVRCVAALKRSLADLSFQTLILAGLVRVTPGGEIRIVSLVLFPANHCDQPR
jgi:hypothetical protein